MKRKRILATLMVLALLLTSSAAFAGNYMMYGDGTKKYYELEDRFGVKYLYYDAFDGAKVRVDTRNQSRFLREILETLRYLPGTLTQRCIARSWNFEALNWIIDAAGIKPGGSTVDEMVKWFRKEGYANEGKILMESQGMEATELAIREKLAQEVRENYSKYSRTTADFFNVNEELKEIDYKGPTFIAMNTYFHDGFWTGFTQMAIATVFYDFEYGYLEDGKIADSGAGAETDIAKAKGKKGVAVDEGEFKPVQTSWVENNTKQDMVRNISFNDNYTTTMENSVTHTEETEFSEMVGFEIKTTSKVPLVAETEVTYKAEWTGRWMGSTAKGHSESASQSLTYNDGIEYTLPARTKALGKLEKNTGGFSIEYDYPIVVTYKVAQTILYGLDMNQVYALWGSDNDDGNKHAIQNLRNRFENKNNMGYERTHSYGHPLDWNSTKGWDTSVFKDHMIKEIPMSVTGGKINVSGSSYRIKVEDSIPIDPIGLLDINGSDIYQIQTGESFNLSALVPVQAYADFGENDVPFFGFDDEEDGHWTICDEKGAPASSDLASIEHDGDECVLKAGEKPGTVYVKYLLDENKNYNIANGEGDDTTVTSVPFDNDSVDNDTITTVIINLPEQKPAFTGKVEIAGPVEAALFEPTWLLTNGPALKFFDADGKELRADEVEHPIVWSVVGGNNEKISIVNNTLTVNEKGDYQVVATVDEVVSNPATVVFKQGVPVNGIELDPYQIILSKGDSATLTATVYPENASDKRVVWESMNPDVVMVDQQGNLKALKTGLTSVAVTTVDGEFRAICDAKVEVAQDGKMLDIGNLALVKGKSYKLGTPGGATGTWMSDDETIAKVNNNGKVTTGKNLGETLLTFIVSGAKEGAKFLGKDVAPGDVIVVPVAVRKKGEVVNKLTLSTKKLILAPGETYTISTTLKPAKAVEKQIYYKTSKKDVALVDDYGVISGIANGKATITATSASGKTAKINVTVSSGIDKIVLSDKKLKMVPGEVYKLLATPVPMIEGFAPVFNSSKEKVATIDADGMITAVSKGKTTIKVFASPGSKIVAKCVVTVP